MKYKLIGVILLIVGIVWTLEVPIQSDFYSILLGFACAFLGYLILLKKLDVYDFKFVIVIAFVTRISLIFSFPNLSDDVYRFYWDAYLLLDGVSPYTHLPASIINDFPNLKLVFDNLNSQEYYSIYPPFNQLLYAISMQISGENVDIFALVLKLIYIGLEIMGIFYLGKLLKFWKFSAISLALYALNPLVIVEGIGNLHIEVVSMAFLAISLFYIAHQKWVKGALNYAVAAGIKLNPLLMIPYFWFRLQDNSKHRFFFAFVSFFLLMMGLIFVNLDIDTFIQSVDLYFRKFEFNASLYYVLRMVGKWLTGYNQIAIIGPLLAIIAASAITRNFFIYRKMELKLSMKVILFSWVLYLFVSTTIHPWYIIPILFFGVFTPFRFMYIWSFMIVLTYINYSYPIYKENVCMIWIEYLVVIGVLIYESQSLLKRKLS